MTATTRPPEGRVETRRRRLRFASLETLGFSDSTHTWSDAPTLRLDGPKPRDIVPQRGRHEAGPDPLSDWHPEDFGGRLTGGNIRWSVMLVLVMLVAGAAGVGYWLYQRPAAIEHASLATVTGHATALDTSLSALEAFTAGLLEDGQAIDTSALFELEGEARTLFSSSGSLQGPDTDLRTAALRAASSTLDGIRLASDAYSYRSAVLPILRPPQLETEPELVALDEAARQFGAWQLSFDQVRTALSDQVLPDVTQQLDILSGDLTPIMGRYVDALRENDQNAANGALLELTGRLSSIESAMSKEIAGIQDRVTARVTEARESLDRLLGR